MADDDSSSLSGSDRRRAFSQLLRRVAMTLLMALAVVASLLSFPSVLPWMVAFWLACHTILAARDRGAWWPLLICLMILVAKLVPRTPMLILLGSGLLAVAVVCYRSRTSRPSGRLRWSLILGLWIIWAGVLLEWRAIESCGRPLTLDPSRPVVCLGDSLTEGMLPDRGYPEALKRMIRLPVINVGFSGISTSQALGQLPRVLQHGPQVVIIELGGHDFLKGRSRAETKQNLEALIDAFRAAGAEVILMEIPRGFLFDPFASLEREIAYQRDVQLISDTWLRQIVVMSPVAPPGIWMSEEWRLSDDGIHSNPRGSKAIARRVARALQSMYGDQVLASR